MDALQRYRWRGNIRELRNTVERLVIMTPSDIVRVEDLPSDIRGAGGAVTVPEPAPAAAVSQTAEPAAGNQGMAVVKSVGMLLAAPFIGLARSLAKEFASRNITVNVVAPGPVATDMLSALDDTAREAMLDRVPLGRIGDPDEIAAAIEFLASDPAGYITGTVLAVDGGLAMG